MASISIKSKKYGEKIVLIDDEVFDLVSRYKWFIQKDENTFYAYGYLNIPRPNRKAIKMHRFILSLSNPKDVVDHIDGNGLNNTASNMRVTSHANNMQNRVSHLGKFKGVWKYKNGKYTSSISINGKQKYLGLFDTDTDAAMAYNNAALLAHGQFARLNVI